MSESKTDQLKAAFLLYCKRCIGQAQAIIEDLFPDTQVTKLESKRRFPANNEKREKKFPLLTWWTLNFNPFSLAINHFFWNLYMKIFGYKTKRHSSISSRGRQLTPPWTGWSSPFPRNSSTTSPPQTRAGWSRCLPRRWEYTHIHTHTHTHTQWEKWRERERKGEGEKKREGGGARNL